MILRRRVAAVIAVASALAAGAVLTAASAEAAVTGTPMNLVSAASGRCMTVEGAAVGNGLRAVIFDCNGKANQAWTLTTASEIRVYSGADTKCLEAANSGTAAGTRVQTNACSGGANQKFTVETSGWIRGTQSNLCLDVSGGGTSPNNTPVVLWPCSTTAANQRWGQKTPPVTTPPPPPPAGGKHAWPYLDITATTPSLASAAAASGHKFYTLAFVIGGSAGCAPTWGGSIPLTDSRIGNDIKALRSAGGDVTVAFGGAAGPYLEHVCSTQAALAGAYEKVIDTLGVHRLDVDIEATVNIDMMTKALAQVQRERAGTSITFTLMVQGDDYGLNDALGVDVLKSAKANGVNVGTVNPMTMEFGSARADWGDAVIAAANSTLKQMALIWPEKSDAQRKAMLGITPMIGRNYNGRIFQIEDGQQIVSWANSNHIASVAFWSVGRDNGGCPGGGVSPTCSSIAQSAYQFTKIFAGFTG
ncbi:MAG: chitinase [Cryptosporangiaceae bacterium]|nr:chitinase [Cryptosporangiaceae bacterium]